MTFVPVVTTPPPPPSEQAQELAGLVEMVIREYRQKRPETRDHDVRQALQLATHRTCGSPAALRAVFIAGILALTLGLGVFFAISQKGGGGGELPVYLVMGLVVLVGVVALAVAVVKRGSS